MARPIRIEYDGATYHVMARGNQGRAIFGDDLDRKVWVETLVRQVKENRDSGLGRLKKRLLKGLNDGRKNEKEA